MRLAGQFMNAAFQLRLDSAEADTFLGVTRSVKGLRWRERLKPDEARISAAICQRYELPDLLGRILAARGGTTDNVADLMDPTLRALLPDPSSLQDMDAGAARIASAIRKGEPVAIFGDYDVDGACSAALMQRFLRAHGRDAVVYIPDRIFEGYGPNVPPSRR